MKRATTATTMHLKGWNVTCNPFLFLMLAYSSLIESQEKSRWKISKDVRLCSLELTFLYMSVGKAKKGMTGI